jgi:hypothetical protein
METKQAIITGIFLGNGSGVLSRVWVRIADAEIQFRHPRFDRNLRLAEPTVIQAVCMFQLQRRNGAPGRLLFYWSRFFQHVDYLYFGIRWSWAHFNFCL